MESRAFDNLKKILAHHGAEVSEFAQVQIETENEKDNPNSAFTVYKMGDVHAFFAYRGKAIAERDVDKALAVPSGRWIIVASSYPSASVQQRVRTAVAEGQRVYLFHIDQLQFDITTHRMAVPHRILKPDERTELFKRFKITDPHEQLPWIDSQDAMARWYGAMPGDVLEITRHSDTGGPSKYWRYCVTDANLT